MTPGPARDYLDYLTDILEAATKAVAFVRGMTFEQFETDDRTLFAVVRALEIVGEAASGEQAIELTRQLLPDVVLLDVSMPGMSGVEATRRIHAECPDVQVIGLSMYDEAEKGKAIRDAGAVAYLSKTSPFETLIAAVRACLDRQ